MTFPSWSSTASRRAYSRLREKDKGFAGPTVAFMGKYDEVAELSPPWSGPQRLPLLMPNQKKTITMQNELLDGIRKDRAAAR
eukprot:gene6669-7984_t